MRTKKSLCIKLGALAVLLAVAALMFVIGRGHTVYFDNKAFTYEGTEYACPYKVSIYVNGEQAAKLYDGERGMTTWIGQNFKMTLKIMQEKNSAEITKEYSIKLPYNMDGVVVNLPAYLAGLPEAAYMSEFVSLIPEDSSEDEDIIIDEFGVPDSADEGIE